MANKLDLIAAKGSKFSNSCFSFTFDIYNRDTQSVPLSALTVTSFGWIGQRLTGSPDWGVVSAGKLTQHTTLGSFNGQNGVQVLNQFNTTYRVFHATIDPTKTSPMLTFNIPVGGAAITPPSVSTISADFFDITLADAPPSLGYSVSWFLPSYSADAFNGSIPELLNPTVSYYKLMLPSVTNGNCDTQINITWPNSTQVIPVGYKMENVEIFVNVDPIDTPENWRTKLPDSKASTNTIILYQNGTQVTEYLDGTTIDPNTGSAPDNNNTIYINAVNSVYIDSTSGNPIATTASDKDFLFTAQTRKTLVKFSTTSLPVNRTVKKAVLRLCANGIYSGEVNVSQVTEDWTETQATFSNRKTNIPWSIAGGTSTQTTSTYVKTISSDFFIDLDVTTIVNSWRLGYSNFGFLVESNTPMQFSSTRAVSALDTNLPYSSPYLLVLSDTATVNDAAKITITSPSDSYIFKNSDTFSLVATADSGVASLSAFKVENYTETFLGTMADGGSNWTYTSAASAVMSTNASIYVAGVSGTNVLRSLPISVSINQLPVVTITTPTIITSASTFTVSGYITDAERFISGNTVQILSGSNVTVTSTTTDGSGSFGFTLPGPGSYTLSAKVYESNPLMSGTFSITRFTVDVVKVSASLTIAYPNARLGGNVIVPNMKVVPSTFDYSSSVSVTGSSYSVNYYMVKNGVYYPLINSGTTMTINDSGENVVVMKVNTSYGEYVVPPQPVYVRKSSLTLNVIADTACSPIKTINGLLVDTDRTAATIDVGISVGLYRNNILIDNISIQPDGSFDQEMSILDPGTGLLTAKVLDAYGTVSTTVAANIGTVYDPEMPFNMIVSGTGVNYTHGNVFGTSAITVSISADAISDSKAYSFVFTTSAGTQNIVTATNNVIPYAIAPNDIVNILTTCYTNGGCVFSTSAVVFHNFAPEVVLYKPNYPKCYCSSEVLEITATVKDVGIYSDRFADLGITYTQNITGGFNSSVLTSAISSKGRYALSISAPSVVGMTSAYLNAVDSLGNTSYTTITFKTVTQSPVIELVSPVTNTNYVDTATINFATSVTTGNVKSVKYYADGKLIGTSNVGPNFEFAWTGEKPSNSYSISAVGTSPDGCSSNVVTKTLVVANDPYVKILGNYKEDFDVNFVAPNTTVTVEAYVTSHIPITSVFLNYVNLNGDTGINYVNPMTYDSARNVWIGEFFTSASFFGNVFASAFDINNTWGKDIVTFKTVDLMTATAYIEGSPSSATSFLDEEFPVTVYYGAGTARSVTKLEIYSNNKLIKTITENAPVPGGNSMVYIPSYLAGVGDNLIHAVAYDDFGLSAASNSVILTVVGRNPTSKPIIRLINNVPENKVSSTSITAVFEVYDLTNGILNSSIDVRLNGVVNNSNIQSHNSIKSYYVTTVINKSGYVTISAMNRIGVSAEYRFNNYIISCSTGRQINLTNYLPEYLQEDIDGNDSETKKFLGVFESTLNSLYNNFDNGCNLSTLEKVNRLQKLHDIDSIDTNHISNYANLLGYHSGPNASEIGEFGYFEDPDQYTDSIEEYKNKALRFVVRNLPNWYSIKTTRNSLKIMLLSYGIIGDMIEYYTTDYNTDWIQNRLDTGNYVEVDMPENAFPTPHMAIGVDITRTNNELVQSNSLKNVMVAMDSIRPANVVITGITGIIGEVKLPSFNIRMRHENKATIYVGPNTLSR